MHCHTMLSILRSSVLCVYGYVGCVLLKCHQYTGWHQWSGGRTVSCDWYLHCCIQLYSVEQSYGGTATLFLSLPHLALHWSDCSSAEIQLVCNTHTCDHNGTTSLHTLLVSPPATGTHHVYLWVIHFATLQE